MATVKLLSWNVNRRPEPWAQLVASGDIDVALLQEATPPPPGLAIRVDDAEWTTAGVGIKRAWRTAVVQVSDRVRVRWRAATSIPDAPFRQLFVSRPGTLAVADIDNVATGEVFTVASVYAAWEDPVAETNSRWIYADASAHRLISDLSCLIGHKSTHRVIVAGDWNLLHGYGENGSPYWAGRYQTIFDRMDAIGLPFVGPQHPAGLQADPWPEELPQGSKDVPTFRQPGRPPTRQLDFVFASKSLRDRLTVTALNGPDEWGPSDHCRVVIELG